MSTCMNMPTPAPAMPSLAITLVLAEMLEKLDNRGVRVDPDQYRLVVDRLAEALRHMPPGEGLSALLDTHPAAVALYENLHYQHAGLCRSPLDAALAAEMAAKQALAKARHHPKEGTLHGKN